MYIIKELRKTCPACPSQWEGKLDNGKMIYIRYRWSCLSVSVSEKPTNDIMDAVNGRTIYEKYIGDELGFDGYLEDDEMFFVLKDILKKENKKRR